MADLTEEQTAIIEKVEKLLRLANKNSNEAEAAAATAKAQELLTAYNLDMAVVGEHNSSDAKREQAKLKGGAYNFQRTLWNQVARLNFCIHWNDQRSVPYEVRKRSVFDGRVLFLKRSKYQWHHYMVGRVVNVRSTQVMAEYLEGAVERLTRERLTNSNGILDYRMLFSRWAISYRTGAVDRIAEKIRERRTEMVAEENRKRAAATRAGTGSGSSLTISTYKSAEEDANFDFLYGEGWSAKRAAERAQQAAAARAAEEAYTQWAAAHPEEARKQEEEARKQREKTSKRRTKNFSRGSNDVDSSAYWAGYDAGEAISIDQQMSDGKSAKRIGK